VVLIVLAAIAGTVDQRRGVAPAVGDGNVNVYSVMSRQEQIISSPAPFQGGRMTSVMGSSTLDLRNAAIAPGSEAVLDVLALMGGLDLIVPDDWVVDVRTVAVMGGVEDSRGRINRRRQRDSGGTSPPAPDTSPSGPPPRVVVRGLIMMGGLNINP
jgi:hypothetical protein